MSSKEIQKSLWDSTKEKGTKIIAGTLIALGAVGLAGCAKDVEAQPTPTETTQTAEPTPTVEPEPTPTETTPETPYSIEGTNIVYEADPVVTPENRDKLLESLRINPEASAEEQAEQLVSIINRWGMAGATPETATHIRSIMYDESGTKPSTDEVINDLVAANTPVYAEALLGPEWENLDGSYGSLIAQLEDINRSNLNRFARSSSTEDFPNSNEKNIEAYWSTISLDSVLNWEDQDNNNYQGPPNMAPVHRAQDTFNSEYVTILTYKTVEANNAENNIVSTGGAGVGPYDAEANGREQYAHAVLVPDQSGALVLRYLEYATQLNNNGEPRFIGDY